MAANEEYSYRAADATGKMVTGTLEGSSRDAVVGALRGRGLTPLDVSVVSKTGLNTEIRIPWLEGHVKADTLAVFSRQMAGLLNAGLPLLRALAVLIEQAEDKKLKAALSQVRTGIEQGQTLSAAMGRHPKVFPPLMVSLVRVGEMGGFLAQTMTSAADTYKTEAELQNKIKSATTYPVIVLIIALLGALGMVMFIVPIFASMFDNLGSELPLPTQVLVGLSQNMGWIFPLLVVLVIGGFLWWQSQKHTDRVRSVVDPWRLKIPVFGKLATKVAVARFSRGLAMMLGAGVPLVQALDIVGQAANNFRIEQAVRAVQESIKQGKSFSKPLEESGVFPSIVVQMAAVGEESGTLPDMLESIAEFYDDEVKTATEQLTSAIEPLLIVGIGILIGGMVVSLYLPIFSIYGEIANT
ncbi:type II secretion system F family protein [Leucobacter weissii]|uniref:Type II secretion system F family protein n=2 Tax=Leucobacter weissii TaxID=1983706 RepID=A0A939MM22_9MICO|nr:type II secretion system F family protein [Leucobacter weissii]